MASNPPEEKRSLSQLAIELDGHFTELTRINGQLERMDIDSESGLDHAVKLLNQFAEHGKSISGSIQDFAQALQEARQQSEAEAQAVAARAQSILERKNKQNHLRAELSKLKENVQAANSNLAGLRIEGKTDFTNEERLQLKAGLERINQDLKTFVADVQAIKESAGQSKFKSIEHQAKDLLDALRASSRKIDQVTAG